MGYIFNFGREVYPGQSERANDGEFEICATVYADDDYTPPWDREDGHGQVSDWRGRNYAKSPGERLLHKDRGGARFYDMAAAVAQARREHWGPSPYRLEIEAGAHGLVRANVQWFRGRELIAIVTPWQLGANDARTDAYGQLRERVGAGGYAEMAAFADFERLRRWCDDQWSYVGVSVTVGFRGVQLVDDYECALWGIESDCGEYVAEIAAELAEEAMDAARAKLESLAA
jgi:hypothetical protein